MCAIGAHFQLLTWTYPRHGARYATTPTRAGHVQGVVMINLKSTRLIGWVLIAASLNFLWVFVPMAGIVLHNLILGTGWGGIENSNPWALGNLLASRVIPGWLLLVAGVFVLKRVKTIDKRIGIAVVLVATCAFSISYAIQEMPLIAPHGIYLD